jgi:hypothetical protein
MHGVEVEYLQLGHCCRWAVNRRDRRRMKGTSTARFAVMSSLAAAAVFLFPVTAPALVFNGIDVGAKFHEDQARSALGVQSLNCKQVDDEVIPIECAAEAEIDGLSTRVLVAVDKDREIAQLSFTVDSAQFTRFEQICMSRLGTPSTREKSFLAAKGGTWYDNWFFADGSRASLLEYSSVVRGSSMLLLMSRHHRDRMGL